MKRHAGRMAWVAFTNIPICILSVYALVDVRQREILENAKYPPPPSLWTVFFDNYQYPVALGLAGLGFLLEAFNRPWAGYLNCGFWLVYLVYYLLPNYYIPQKIEALYAFILLGIFLIHFLWYVIPARQRSSKS